jgi:hypothetical protein
LAQAETLRLATYHGDFSRKGPGLFYKELLNKPPVMDALTALSPDVLLLTDIDFDAGNAALGALADRLGGYPHLFSQRPNRGTPTGVDLDGDGRLGGPRDAQGFGYYSGQGGMALMSRYPLRLTQDHTGLLWRDLPGNLMPENDPARDIQRLSTTAHWAITVDLPTGPLTLLTLSATTPVFDGPEDRNGRRNHDELILLQRMMDEADQPLVVMGHFNLDPVIGEGRHDAVQTIMNDPRLHDPLPNLPTVHWDSVGALRVSYVLPDAGLDVRGAGRSEPIENLGPHRVIWVDLALP